MTTEIPSIPSIPAARKKHRYERVRFRGAAGSYTTLSIHPGQFKIWLKYADAKTIRRLCRESAVALSKTDLGRTSISAATRVRVSEILRLQGSGFAKAA